MISYVNEDLIYNYCDSLEEVKNEYGINQQTIIIESEKEKQVFRLLDKIDESITFRNTLTNQQMGYMAEKYFRETCAEASLVTVRMEQSAFSYKNYYQTVRKEHVKRPDFYILSKDIFVEVKARSMDHPNQNYFVKLEKDDVDAYKAFQKLSKKKILLALYRIEETQDVLKDTLRMIELDAITEDNEKIILYNAKFNTGETKDFYEIPEDACVKGLSLLTDE
ncbi:MAG: hypothetical protein K5786_03440 [Treponema sp.]|nr:hypothetical protein [Treponema sp.]